jgi:hypothetical protein
VGYDSNGNWTLTPGYLAIAGQTIQPSQHNPVLEDIGQNGLSAVLVRDGRAPMTGALNMNGFKVTNLLAGSNPLDVVNKQQLDGIVTTQSKSADYTVLVADKGAVISVDASGGARTITLPAAATAGAGFPITIKKSDSSGNTVTIDANGSETIDGSLVRGLSTQYQSISLVCDGAGWRIIAGSGSITVSTLANATGSAVDFIGIPAGVKRITLAVIDVSTTGAFTPVLQLGDSGGIETTGYSASNTLVVNAAATSITTFTNPGFPFGGQNAGNTYNGKIVLDLLNPATNLWICSGIVGAATLTSFPSGYKATSTTLDRIRFIVGGSDTYDAGAFNISWEF